MYLFNKTIRYDFDYRDSDLITVGIIVFDGNLIQSINGIIYNDQVEQIGVFSYENNTLKITLGEEVLIQEVLEKLLEELDKINITE